MHEKFRVQWYNIYKHMMMKKILSEKSTLSIDKDKITWNVQKQLVK